MPCELLMKFCNFSLKVSKFLKHLAMKKMGKTFLKTFKKFFKWLKSTKPFDVLRRHYQVKKQFEYSKTIVH